MKKFITYIHTALFGCLLFTSCSQDESLVADCAPVTENAYVELQLFMPAADNQEPSRSPVIDPETGRPSYSEGKEAGTEYENKIVGASDLSVFVFALNGTYLGMATDFTYMPPTSAYPDFSMLKGKLPVESIGQPVKLVLMANYRSRGVTLQAPGKKKYAKWLPVNKFSFDQQIWLPTDEADNRYIPMSGEYVFTSPIETGMKNYGSIELTRSIAKVRIQAGDNVTITKIQVNQAQNTGYSLPQPTIKQIQGVAFDSYVVPMTKNLEKGESFYFYLPEQPQHMTTLRLTFADASENDLEFKNYRAEVTDPNTDHTYPIVRNHLYDYIVSKRKADGVVDIRGNVLDWRWHELSTDIE